MNIFEEAKASLDYAISVRRRLHEHPETMGEEVETMKFICAQLDEMGIPYVKVENGGIIGQIHGAKPGKMLLMRGDIDALPIEENPMNLKQKKCCVSKIPGVSHACGHDAHTAMLLTEAKILNAHKDELSGTVVLCFEQGEEGGGQFKNLFHYIVEEAKLPIAGCFGTHVKWDVKAGQVSIEPGAVISGGYGFEIRLHGLTGHGSRPDLAHSVLDCFHGIYTSLNMLRMKYVNPYDILTFSIGKLECGTKMNIIPDELTFAGTIRTFSVNGGGKAFMEEFIRILDHETSLHHCTWEAVRLPSPLFECYNNEVCSQIAKNAVRTYMGEEFLTAAEPWMACESFSAYLKLWPGVISFTGIENEAMGCGANHHTSEFDLDESGMAAGVAAAVGYAVDFLNYKGEIPFTPYDKSLTDLVERNL